MPRLPLCWNLHESPRLLVPSDRFQHCPAAFFSFAATAFPCLPTTAAFSLRCSCYVSRTHTRFVTDCDVLCPVLYSVAKASSFPASLLRCRAALLPCSLPCATAALGSAEHIFLSEIRFVGSGIFVTV